MASANAGNSSAVVEESVISPFEFNWISSSDLAKEALAASGNTGYTVGALPAYIVTEAAKIFAGAGYTMKLESGGFWFYSSDGLRRVRTGQKVSFNLYQANFEKFSRTGYNDNYRTSNYHVNVSE